MSVQKTASSLTDPDIAQAVEPPDTPLIISDLQITSRRL
jgi:hypothetical protein